MKLIAFTLTAILAAAPSLAQESRAGSQSSANQSLNSINASGAYSYNGGINQTFESAPATQTINTRSSGSLRTTPNVSAPGVITAHNCALPVSAGGSGVGFGLALGMAYVDRNCELISQSAALSAVAGKQAAILHLARDESMCQTLRASGLVKGNCGDTPTTTVASKSAKPSAPAIAYRKCEKRGSNLVVKVKAGADKNLAIAQCQARF